MAFFTLLHLLGIKFRSIVENSNGVFCDLYEALLRFSVLLRIKYDFINQDLDGIPTRFVQFYSDVVNALNGKPAPALG